MGVVVWKSINTGPFTIIFLRHRRSVQPSVLVSPQPNHFLENFSQHPKQIMNRGSDRCRSCAGFTVPVGIWRVARLLPPPHHRLSPTAYLELRRWRVLAAAAAFASAQPRRSLPALPDSHPPSPPPRPPPERQTNPFKRTEATVERTKAPRWDFSKEHPAALISSLQRAVSISMEAALAAPRQPALTPPPGCMKRPPHSPPAAKTQSCPEVRGQPI